MQDLNVIWAWGLGPSLQLERGLRNIDFTMTLVVLEEPSYLGPRLLREVPTQHCCGCYYYYYYHHHDCFLW